MCFFSGLKIRTLPQKAVCFSTRSVAMTMEESIILKSTKQCELKFRARRSNLRAWRCFWSRRHRRQIRRKFHCLHLNEAAVWSRIWMPACIFLVVISLNCPHQSFHWWRKGTECLSNHACALCTKRLISIVLKNMQASWSSKAMIAPTNTVA